MPRVPVYHLMRLAASRLPVCTTEVRRHVPDDLGVLAVLALAVPPLAVHDGRVHVGGGEGVGLVQQRDDAQQDGPEEGDTEGS